MASERQALPGVSEARAEENLPFLGAAEVLNRLDKKQELPGVFEMMGPKGETLVAFKPGAYLPVYANTGEVYEPKAAATGTEPLVQDFDALPVVAAKAGRRRGPSGLQLLTAGGMVVLTLAACAPQVQTTPEVTVVGQETAEPAESAASLYHSSPAEIVAHFAGLGVGLTQRCNTAAECVGERVPKETGTTGAERIDSIKIVGLQDGKRTPIDAWIVKWADGAYTEQLVVWLADDPNAVDSGKPIPATAFAIEIREDATVQGGKRLDFKRDGNGNTVPVGKIVFSGQDYWSPAGELINVSLTNTNGEIVVVDMTPTPGADTPTPTPGAGEGEVTPEQQLLTQQLLEKMEQARATGQETFTMTDMNGVEITVDVAPAETIAGATWDWNLRGFTRQTGRGTEVWRTQYLPGEERNGEWLVMLDKMDLTAQGLGIVTLEGNPEALSQSDGNRPAMNPHLNPDSEENLLRGLNYLWGDSLVWDTLVVPDYGALAKWRLGQIPGGSGGPKPAIFKETISRKAGVTFEIVDTVDDSFANAFFSTDGRLTGAWKTRVEGGRCIVSVYAGESVFEEVDYTEGNLNFLGVAILQWLSRQENEIGVLTMLGDQDPMMQPSPDGSSVNFEPGIEEAFKKFGVQETNPGDGVVEPIEIH